MSNNMKVEGRVLRALYNDPHPNLTSYKGCLVGNIYVIGFYLKNYSKNLHVKPQNGTAIDMDTPTVTKIVDQVRSGLHHLQTLGFYHNDVRMYNVMLDGDHIVLIDYDNFSRINETPMKCSDLVSLERLKMEIIDYARSECEYLRINEHLWPYYPLRRDSQLI